MPLRGAGCVPGSANVNLQAMTLVCPHCQTGISALRVRESFECSKCHAPLTGRTFGATLSVIILWVIVDFFVALFLNTSIANTDVAFVARLAVSMLVGWALFVFGIGAWASVTSRDSEHAN
jgi:tetrahydromethanopterin S-methyltransferase subunit D